MFSHMSKKKFVEKKINLDKIKEDNHYQGIQVSIMASDILVGLENIEYVEIMIHVKGEPQPRQVLPSCLLKDR